jgi:hypothetical protein
VVENLCHLQELPKNAQAEIRLNTYPVNYDVGVKSSCYNT